MDGLEITVDVALHVRAEHAEGPLWDDATRRLWWVDIIRERVHCFEPASGRDCSWSTPGQPGGLVLDTAGEPVVAMPGGLAALDQQTGALEMLVPIEADRPDNRANDVKVDSAGRAWVGSMAYDMGPGNAALYRVDGDRVTRVVDGLTISNGPAFDEEGGRMYLADTPLGIVDVFDMDPSSGLVQGRRRFVDVSAQGFWPDGMTVDDEGMLWVAMGRAGAVHRYDPEGRLVAVVELPTSSPTSVAFGGDDLYITSSWYELDPSDRVGQELAGAIFRCRPGVTGPPSPRWRRPEGAR